MRKEVAAVLALVIYAGLPSPSHATPGAGAEVSGVVEEEFSPHDRLVKKYPFRDSSFVWFRSLGANGLVKSNDLTWKPLYSWLFRLYPRYYFTDKLYVSVKLGLEVELTNSPDTTTYREPLFEDIWLDLGYKKVYTIPVAKVDITPSLRLVLPTSKAARAESLVMGVGPGFGLKRSFKLPWKKMSVDLSYSFRYIKHFNQNTTVQLDGQPISGCVGLPDSGNCGAGLQTGDMSVNHQFQNLFVADLNITDKLSFEAFVGFFNKLAYSPPDATLIINGQPYKLGPEEYNNVIHRASIWYLFELAYQFHPTTKVGLGISTWASQLAPDSTYRAPFINRATEFMLSTTVALDQVVARAHHSMHKRHMWGL
jgi:hypothetical protein